MTLGSRRGASVALTPKELLARVGRVMLWVALAVVLARGLAGMLSARSAPAPAGPGGWALGGPDAAARAFAREFAAPYLDVASGDDPAAAAKPLGRFASGELWAALAPRLNGPPPHGAVGSVTTADAELLDRSHALI